ncbi:MAG: cell wall-binding repeat-containing protein [Clostridiaceae bacterium]|nr:cell wall-binding repeat-containing protein [Clostridiaceae bacterium]
MLKRNKNITAAIAGGLLATAFTIVNSSTASAASSRLWGQDRYETSAAISKEGWTTSDYVVVASGEGYADALCAAPLAKKYNAPILLTEGKDLNSKTKEEIKRLNAKHVFIIGKYASVSQNTEDELKSTVGEVKRLGGNDRYETSVIVAKELGTVDNVVITSGYGFADALSIAPIAAQMNMPILLTGKDSLPEVVKDYINNNNSAIKNSYVVGGQGVISDEAAGQIPVGAVRLSGRDRFETNLNVMKYFQSQLKFDNLYVVQADGPTGKEFADALSGAALAAKTSSPIILTYKTISSDVESYIKNTVKNNTSITALGGTAAVPEALVEQLNKAIEASESAVKQPQKPETPQTPTAGGGGGGSSTVDNTNDQLKSIINKLSSIIPNLNTENEKNVANRIIDTMNKVIADSSYAYKKDADSVKKAYNALSDAEKKDLQDKVLSKMDLSELLQLKNKFGL